MWWSSKKREKILTELHCELEKGLQEYECEFVRTGKKSRPLLLILAYELCKHLGCENRKSILPAAAAVELLHKSSLLHDDIVDKDDFRRGLPTFHLKYGLSSGIIFGDLLTSRAFEKLSHLGPDDQVLGCFKEALKAYRSVQVGQHLNLFRTLRLESYSEIIRMKSCSLLEAAAVIGAILAGVGKEKIKNLRGYAQNLGFAAQIINDIKDTIGWEKKKIYVGGTDIWEGRWNYVLINTVNTLEPFEKKAVLELVAKRKKDEKNVKFILEFVKKTGSVEKARKAAEMHLKLARESLEVFPASNAKTILNNVATLGFFDRYW